LTFIPQKNAHITARACYIRLDGSVSTREWDSRDKEAFLLTVFDVIPENVGKRLSKKSIKSW
jgi:hypothetical protein